MSEQLPTPAIPQPPKESHWGEGAPLSIVFGDQTEPVRMIDKRNEESKKWSLDKNGKGAQENLDADSPAVNAIEALPVSESPFANEEVAYAAPAAEKEIPKTSEAEPPHKRPQQSHNDFHTERPAPAIQRVNATSYQHATGTSNAGKFATATEYEIQNGSFEHNSAQKPDSAQKHYDEVTSLNNNEAAPATPERADYEKMDIDQLAFAAAKANLLGDTFAVDQIKDVYATPFQEAYTDPENPTLSLEDYEAAITRFDTLVKAATEYERAKDPEHYELVDAAVERANKEPSVGDKLKKWWGKNSESILMKFKPTYWAERWTNAVQPKIGEMVTSALNIGVNLEEDTPEVIEKKRKRNRVVFMAGGAALAVAAIAAPAFGIGFSAGGGGQHAAEALGQGGGGTGHVGSSVGEGLSSHDQAVVDALRPHEVANNVAPPAPEFNVNDPGFTVSSGEGGYALFHNLNLPDSVWDTNQATLLQRFPDNFYPMGNGAVGINNRPLSDAAKEFINTLRA